MGDNYVDLFATKGLEYILVIAFLVTLVVFWRFLNRPTRRRAGLAAGAEPRGVTTPWFQLPEGFYYHQGHSWAMPEHGDVVTVGIDDFAQKLLGRPSALHLPGAGARLEQGEKGWEILVDGISVPMLSPIDGEVVEVNEEVVDSPDLLSSDPYGQGWLLKIRPSRVKSDLRNLLSGKLAKTWMDQTVDALRGKLPGNLGVVLQDGGVPVSGIAKQLSSDRWPEIAMEFLLSK